MFISMKLAYLLAGMALTLPAFTNTANTKFIDAVIAQPPTILSPLPTTLAQVRPTADFDSAPNRNLLQAVEDGDLKAVRAALEEGANPNTEKAADDGEDSYVTPTALMLAAEHNYLEIARVLIEHGANVNGKDTSFYIGYPLSIAASKGDLEMVTLLLSKGAEVNAPLDEGYTALWEAVGGRHTEVVEVLLKHGADPNIFAAGVPLLYNAASAGYVEAVRLLIASGTDVNVNKGSTETPLYGAASNGYVQVVRLLIASGADVNASKSGQTPRAIAEQKGYTEIVNLLKQAGAQ